MQFVPGVGPRLGALLASRGLKTARDVLFFFPRAYEDRTQVATSDQVKEGERQTFAIEILSSRKIPLRTGKRMLEVRAQDARGPVSLKWFHAPPGMEKRFVPGSRWTATGVVKIYQGSPQIIHPEMHAGGAPEGPVAIAATATVGGEPAGASADASPHLGRLVPIYTELEGIPSRTFRKILWEAMERYGRALPEDLPARLREAYALPTIRDAVRELHFPEGSETGKLLASDTPAHRRLIYEEFLKFEYLVLRQRMRAERALASALGETGRAGARDLEAALPFRLTGDQSRALAETMADLARPHPMNRLLQGDVGSGKTAVAFLAAGAVLAEGGQAALMAPTEILAEQHARTAVRLLGTRLRVALLTGRTPAAERARLFPRLAAGEPTLVIGTHALIEDPVKFKALDLVIIDEQHRFGVEQRRALRRKGSRVDPVSERKLNAHALVLSATPIPRTLALTAYGDLAVSSIQELPPGRQPIATRIAISADDRKRVYEAIRQDLAAGRQAYFIFPLVNESEAEGFEHLKSATAEFERLSREVFPEFRAGLLHGQMSGEEKDAAMLAFQRGETQILASTTVVEVGVDVPNATIMAVEHAERFGLSQLHQLRGRVGRGTHASRCFLLSHPGGGEGTAQRLGVLTETQDGFRIAEADLDLRGPGEFLGTRQAGGLPFRMANLVRDREWLFRAREDALALLRDDPELTMDANRPLRAYFLREGHLEADRLQTS